MTRAQILVFLSITLATTFSKNIPNKESEVQGLYTAEDKVSILFKNNFNNRVFNKNHAWLIEFYNSWCGFCKRFAPEWKEFASDVYDWKDIVSIGAIDCANDENNGICRNYEILAYPTIKYFHEDYVEGTDKLGEALNKGSDARELREILVKKLLQEQSAGRGQSWPLLSGHNYNILEDILVDLPNNVEITFLIFEPENSTLATETILDLNEFSKISIKKVLSTSGLAKSMNLLHFPSLVSVNKDLMPTVLTFDNPSRAAMKEAIAHHLNFKSVYIKRLSENKGSSELMNVLPHYSTTFNINNKFIENGDVVYQSDLETGLRYTLSNEITKIKHISGNALSALKDYLSVIVKYFPFTANGKVYMTELRDRVLDEKIDFTGEKFASTINELEEKHAPVYSTLSEWVGCKGSASHYRGFSCSLWTMFHVLTVSAAEQKTTDASEVLRAMHGYVKHFFGCADCSQHFQAMAERNRLFSVAENDGAIIWLWEAHNEVNHRLAGDSTEDPQHPKRQFPVTNHCPKCWREAGPWDLDEVLKYLKNIYGTGQINLSGVIPHPSFSSFTSLFSTFDVAFFVVIYVYFTVMLIFILRIFLVKRSYKKKLYKRETSGKV